MYNIDLTPRRFGGSFPRVAGRGRGPHFRAAAFSTGAGAGSVSGRAGADHLRRTPPPVIPAGKGGAVVLSRPRGRLAQYGPEGSFMMYNIDLTPGPPNDHLI